MKIIKPNVADELTAKTLASHKHATSSQWSSTVPGGVDALSLWASFLATCQLSCKQDNKFMRFNKEVYQYHRLLSDNPLQVSFVQQFILAQKSLNKSSICD